MILRGPFFQFLRRYPDSVDGEQVAVMRDWVRKWVKRICEVAGVPKVTAHGMRVLHSTLAVENGVSAHVVAASLGHESSATTIQSYVKPEAVAGAQQRRVMTVLEGGRLAS